MWQRFTERARRVILFAQEEATTMNSAHVGTEHLLLGLVREEAGVAAEVLKKFGIAAGPIYDEVKAAASPGGGASGEPRLTPKAKRVLELAADEARRMHHDYIGTEHLLLALLRETDGLAATVLKKLGLNLARARSAVADYLIAQTRFAEPSATRTPTPEAAHSVTAITRAHFDVSFGVQLALSVAAERAANVGTSRIEVSHLLLALLHNENDLAASVLQKFGLNLDEVRAAIREGIRNESAE